MASWRPLHAVCQLGCTTASAYRVVRRRADELFDPFRTDEQALSFTHALADESVSVVFAVSTIRPIRIPEHCNTRIVFPCGERTSDLMAGVPARLLDMMSHIDADNAGRAVLIEGTSACLVQCAS